MHFRRRDLLAGTAIFLLSAASSRASVIFDQLPWTPDAGNPPLPVRPGPWVFFTGAEGRAMEARKVTSSTILSLRLSRICAK